MQDAKKSEICKLMKEEHNLNSIISLVRLTNLIVMGMSGLTTGSAFFSGNGTLALTIFAATVAFWFLSHSVLKFLSGERKAVMEKILNRDDDSSNENGGNE